MKAYNLIGGTIITLNSQDPIAQSITINAGKIESINKPNNSYQSINLDGATAIPGFIDAHFHLKNFGKRLDMLNLKGINSINQATQMIKNKLLTLEANQWLIGFGWDQNLWDGKQYPNEKILNSIAPNNPIYLTRIDGHSAWVNDAAIHLTHHSKEQINNISGGSLINDCILIDNAMNLFKNILPKDSKKEIKRWIKIAIQKIIQRGITGIHDAWQDQDTIEVIQDLIEENQFPIRCYGMIGSSNGSLLEKYFSSGHYQDEYLSIRSVKAFIDGALGSRGAALHEPYCDDKNNCGLILISKEEFKEIAQACYQHNFQLNTHAIGDRGNHYVLNHYASVLGKNHDRRWRIEHAQMVSDNDLLRFKEFNIVPSMQPSHCTSDMPWLDDRIGNSRLPLISRWQSFLNLGLKIPGGSDCPIETGNPLFEFYAAITRQDHEGFPKGGWQPQEKINPLDALKMFTSWAAYGGFDENRRGKIDIGYDADLTVLSDNLLTINPKEVLNLKINYTIINGKIVYSNL